MSGTRWSKTCRQQEPISIGSCRCLAANMLRSRESNSLIHSVIHAGLFSGFMVCAAFENGSWQTASQWASESCESTCEPRESSCEPCETDVSSQSILFLRLVYAWGNDLTYDSIRFDISLPNFKKPLDIFWPQLKTKKKKFPKNIQLRFWL